MPTKKKTRKKKSAAKPRKILNQITLTKSNNGSWTIDSYGSILLAEACMASMFLHSYIMRATNAGAGAPNAN